jgi:hypothetical protein
MRRRVRREPPETVFVRQNPVHHGVARLVSVAVRNAGDFYVASGATVPDALRHLARKIEEDDALGPLRDPRRVAIDAMKNAISEMYASGACYGSKALPKLQRARDGLSRDVGFDVSLDLLERETDDIVGE